MNMILPIFLFAAIAMSGVPDGANTGLVEVVAVEPNTPAAQAGLKTGDEIIFLGNQRILNVSQLIQQIQHFKDREVAIDVQRDGELISFNLEPRAMDLARGDPAGARRRAAFAGGAGVSAAARRRQV